MCLTLSVFSLHHRCSLHTPARRSDVTKKSRTVRHFHPPITTAEENTHRNLKTPCSSVAVLLADGDTKVVDIYCFLTMEQFNEGDMKMYFYENRLKTFEGWPFDADCACTPQNVSKRSNGWLLLSVSHSQTQQLLMSVLKQVKHEYSYQIQISLMI